MPKIVKFTGKEQRQIGRFGFVRPGQLLTLTDEEYMHVAHERDFPLADGSTPPQSLDPREAQPPRPGDPVYQQGKDVPYRDRTVEKAKLAKKSTPELLKLAQESPVGSAAQALAPSASREQLLAALLADAEAA